MKKKSCVVVCHCRAGLVSEKYIDNILAELQFRDVDILELDDLCAIAVNEKSLLKDIAANYPFKIVIACYPRAVKSILEQGGIDFGTYHVMNFRELSAGQILSAISGDYKKPPVNKNVTDQVDNTGTGKSVYNYRFNIPAGKANHHVNKTDLDVPAWYPVIESSSCSLCGKCAKFCMFGVYKIDKKNLEVTNPLSCKNNCPACARLCPESAIIFPRWPENSVLSGAERGKEVEPVKQDSMIDKLNSRNRKRKVIFSKDFAGKVERDRLEAIELLKNGSGKKDLK